MSMDVNTVKPHVLGRCRKIILSLAPHLSQIVERGRRHGPCLCGGKDRCRCHNDFDETGGIFCNQCGGGADIFAVLMWANDWDFRQTVEAVACFLGLREGDCSPVRHQPKLKPVKDWSKERELLKSIWRETTPDPDRIAEYLDFRGLGGRVPSTLRYHSSLYYSHDKEKGHFPAMVAQFIRGREVVGLHRTWLDINGPGKAPVEKPKKTIKCTDSMTGGAIRLFKHDSNKPLVVCEGIETALAIHEHSTWPVWACGNSVLLERVLIPSEVHDVFIGVDKDRNQAGQHAAEKLARRLKTEGKKVSVSLPPGPIPEGQSSLDWLDVLSREVVCG